MIRETWRRLAPFVDRPRSRLVAVSVWSLIGGLAEAVVLVLVVGVALVAAGQAGGVGQLPIIDREISPGVALTVAAVLSVLNIAVHYINARVSARLSTDVLGRSRSAAVDSFLLADWDRQSVEREGRLHETVSVLANSASQVTMAIANGVTASLHVVALMGMALLVDPVATVIVIAAGLALFAALRPMARATHRRAAEFLDANGEFLADLSRASTMAMELRAFGVTDAERARLRTQVVDAAERNRLTRIATRFGETLYRDLAIVFLVGAVAVIYAIGATDVAAIGAVVLLVVRAANSAQGIQGMRQQVSEKAPDLERLIERLESLNGAAHHSGTVAAARLGAVELQRVSYAYGDLPALTGVDLTIAPGESIGVVGPSGGGKSTLVQVLLRLRTPTSGTVTVDGLDYVTIRDADWARLVALVPQEPHLMEGTIRDNVVFLRDGVTDTEVEHACRLAHIWDEVQRLPGALDTELGARGSGLSGGQKQRLAIARALIGSPELLVLDEPTSALDADSEDRLRQTLQELRGEVSIVIVTHRPVPLSVCDRVVRVDEGRLGPLERSPVQ